MYLFRPHLWPYSEKSLIKNILQKPQEPLHKCKIVGFKLYGLKYMLKYTTDRIITLNSSEEEIFNVAMLRCVTIHVKPR
jgi:hypothetical protein